MISTSFADDLERTVAVGAQLVSSRPASSPEGGLLVSEPVRSGLREACPRCRGGSRRLGAGHRPLHLRPRPRPAGGGGRRRPDHAGGAGRRAVRAKRCSMLTCPSGRPPSPGTAGCCGRSAASSLRPRSTTTGGRTCTGGRYAGLDPSNGRVVVAGDLPDEVAWGNGGVAVVMAAGRLCAVGRTGRLHWLADPRTGRFVVHRLPGRVVARHRPRGRRR